MKMKTADISREWEEHGTHYRAMVSTELSSSSWLRDTVLKPEIIRLVGDRRADRVLDAGTGSGWLFDEVKASEKYACDIVRPEIIRPDVSFVQADIANLPYQDCLFDAVVSSIVLCYCDDLTQAAIELRRVTNTGGALVVALVHPYFYRTGVAVEDDSFLIKADLSKSERFDILIGGTAGPFTYYRHSIPDYLNSLIRAGWQLEETSELFIPRVEYESRLRNNDLVARSTRVPVFVTFKLRRV